MSGEIIGKTSQKNDNSKRIAIVHDVLVVAGESSDLCLRILSFDKNQHYSPSVHIHHPQPRSTAPDVSQKAYRYAYGMGALCRTQLLLK